MNVRPNLVLVIGSSKSLRKFRKEGRGWRFRRRVGREGWEARKQGRRRKGRWNMVLRKSVLGKKGDGCGGGRRGLIVTVNGAGEVGRLRENRIETGLGWCGGCDRIPRISMIVRHNLVLVIGSSKSLRKFRKEGRGWWFKRRVGREGWKARKKARRRKGKVEYGTAEEWTSKFV